MKLAVVGAAGRTGRAVVAEALARGDEVRALARSRDELDPRALAVLGDARDEELLGFLLSGADAVICVIGPEPGGPADACSSATSHLVAACRESGVRRLIVQTGALIGHPPARLSWIYRLILRMMSASARDELADRRLQERIVRESGLGWTLVRPPRLTAGHPTGRVAVGEDLRVGSRARVDRADLARLLVDAARNPAWIGRSPTVLSVSP